ncbi:response regulator [Olivibacter sp. XZL3]|uniref:response regulator n=1 Tax=Olivibacter sp. XZL3 TaxID=1735116 RepID=UPI001416ED71|nr:response regulator [Olivibacter sp. XZL3]
MMFSFLVIDDDDLDCMIAKKFISLTGKATEISVMQSANEALNFLSGFEYTAPSFSWVIVLDVMMPGMDGFQFLDEFSKFPPSIKRHFRIMILTLSNDPYRLKKLGEYPTVSAVLEKPITLEKLNDTLLKIQESVA